MEPEPIFLLAGAESRSRLFKAASAPGPAVSFWQANWAKILDPDPNSTYLDPQHLIRVKFSSVEDEIISPVDQADGSSERANLAHLANSVGVQKSNTLDPN